MENRRRVRVTHCDYSPSHNGLIGTFVGMAANGLEYKVLLSGSCGEYCYASGIMLEDSTFDYAGKTYIVIGETSMTVTGRRTIRPGTSVVVRPNAPMVVKRQDGHTIILAVKDAFVEVA